MIDTKDRRTFKAALRDKRKDPTPIDDGGRERVRLEQSLSMPVFWCAGHYFAVSGPHLLDVTERPYMVAAPQQARIIACYERTRRHERAATVQVAPTPPRPVAVAVTQPHIAPVETDIEPPHDDPDGLELPAFMNGPLVGLDTDDGLLLERKFKAGQAVKDVVL